MQAWLISLIFSISLYHSFSLFSLSPLSFLLFPASLSQTLTHANPWEVFFPKHPHCFFFVSLNGFVRVPETSRPRWGMRPDSNSSLWIPTHRWPHRCLTENIYRKKTNVQAYFANCKCACVCVCVGACICGCVCVCVEIGFLRHWTRCAPVWGEVWQACAGQLQRSVIQPAKLRVWEWWRTYH